MTERKGVQTSRDGKTVGITLRVEVSLEELYARIANRANIMALKRGGRSKWTTQDVMRHQLQKLRRRLSGKLAKTGDPS